MNVDGPIPPLRVPAREIPVPKSLSPQAREFLRAPVIPPATYPAPGDIDSWRRAVTEYDAAQIAILQSMPTDLPADVEEIAVGEARVFQITPHHRRAADDCVYLDIHGGALIMGGGELCRASATILAVQRGVRVWTVDYRMPPEHLYPAAVDDCLAAYRALLQIHAPEKIIVGGMSAGGNLAAAMILRARDEGLPLPAGAVLLTPEADLTESGDSFQTNLGLDSVLTGSLMPINLLYAGDEELTNPYISPLFADFSPGFPPTLLSAGTRDLFLSNAVRMHWALRAQDVPAELHIVEAASHPGFPGTPEDAALDREIDRFCHRIWRSADR